MFWTLLFTLNGLLPEKSEERSGGSGTRNFQISQRLFVAPKSVKEKRYNFLFRRWRKNRQTGRGHGFLLFLLLVGMIERAAFWLLLLIQQILNMILEIEKACCIRKALCKLSWKCLKLWSKYSYCWSRKLVKNRHRFQIITYDRILRSFTLYVFCETIYASC